MEKYKTYLIGPFAQVITMRNLPIKGALQDNQLEVVVDGGLWIENGCIKAVDNFEILLRNLPKDIPVIKQNGTQICLPSYIDCHTHILYGGNRANDFAMRNAGSNYLEIAEAGGGIWSTVLETRKLTIQDSVEKILQRVKLLAKQGITTIEIKSGYGLNIVDELKSLRAIKEANTKTEVDLIATCLAAHMHPKDYLGSPDNYLNEIAEKLFPLLIEENLTKRVDAFVEKSAFSVDQIKPYFEKAKKIGFDITVHADQFTCGGSSIATDFEALSVDHLEVSTEVEIKKIAQSNTVAVALPAASIGLGCTFTPARKILDEGGIIAIATDFNPGSAPMGQLVASASILATFQKLSNAEILAAITYRAAKALNYSDRGRLQEGYLADFLIYNTNNYQNITYCQGRLQPQSVWKNGKQIIINE